MSTIADIANWVAQDYLLRNDILTVAQNAATQFYKVLCAKVPFDSLMTTSAERPLVSGTDTYSLTDLSPSLRAIASIRITFDAQNRRRLRRSHVRLYDSISYLTPGRPSSYARWADSIQLSPPPNSSSFTYRVRYWSRPTIATPQENTILLTPPEWDELLKWETLFRVYHYVGQQDKAMGLVMPAGLPRQMSPKKTPMLEVGIIPRLWNELLTTVSQQENVDEDFGINPLLRSYSVRR